MLQVPRDFFVLFENGVKVDEWLHRNLVGRVLGGVVDFDIESYRHEVKGIFFGDFAVLLHHLEQVELLGQKLVELHVVHKLLVTMFADDWRCSYILG